MSTKIVVTGPESTGKTTLAQSLAKHYATSWVREYARIYIDNLNQPYEEEDLLAIAKGQMASEAAAKAKMNRLLICDTSLEVIKIWSEVKYRRCHHWILEKFRQQQVDLYLLCAPDIMWTYDPQREHPDDRDQLFLKYKETLKERNYVEIRGEGEARFRIARQAIDALVK